MVCDLTKQKCEPCSGNVPPLPQEEIDKHLSEVEGWQQKENKITKQLTFKNFIQLMGFVNKMADLAENEGHHPDFNVSWNVLDVTIFTHAINGLSVNDFILAAKIDELPK